MCSCRLYEHIHDDICMMMHVLDVYKCYYDTILMLCVLSGDILMLCVLSVIFGNVYII